MTNFEQVTDEAKGKMRRMWDEMNSCVQKGNQTAGKRARKLSLELEKLMKQWRALSTGREPIE